MTIRVKGDEEPLFIADQQLRNEEVVLGTTGYMDRVLKTTLENCVLTISNPDAVLVSRCRLVGCVVRPDRTMPGHRGIWSDNYWQDCHFYGNYVSMHFGSPEEDVHGPSPWGEIAIQGCNFSDTTMHFCSFRRTDVDSIKFPGWPCFTVLQPERNRSRWKDVPAPIPSSMIMNWFSERGRPCDFTEAQVFHWPTIVKEHEKWYQKHPRPELRSVIDADPEEVRRVLAAIDFIRV
jgi:hypothetical protein